MNQLMTNPHLRIARRALGFLALGIGIAGVLLPIIPGWPGFVLAIVLLGRRDPALRWLHLYGRRTLRTLRRSRVSQMRRLGHWLSAHYVGLRRSITPHIIWAEKIFQ
ncbi:MAG: hypothetical protein WCI67_14640 [Chloroflexales bacterium]